MDEAGRYLDGSVHIAFRAFGIIHISIDTQHS